jgi:hypothetical protein
MNLQTAWEPADKARAKKEIEQIRVMERAA